MENDDDNSDKPVSDANLELETIFENSKSDQSNQSCNGSTTVKHNHENPLFFDLMPQAEDKQDTRRVSVGNVIRLIQMQLEAACLFILILNQKGYKGLTLLLYGS